MQDVHAMTDVTGFGLAGHALELARGSGLDVHIAWSQVPLLNGVRALAEAGYITGASARNWIGYSADVQLPAAGFDATDQALLSDPQASGGLLVSCAPDVLADVMAVFAKHGFAQAAVVGEVRVKAGDRAGLSVSK
jgi:selenide,water dikinase